MEKIKYNRIKRELKGLDVTYNKYSDDAECPNMARVNGWSIVWHSWAYGYDRDNVVEVMDKYSDDCYTVNISNLRETVER